MLLQYFYRDFESVSQQGLISCWEFSFSLSLYVNPFCHDPERKGKVNFNFYFHTSSWCLKRFYEGLKGLYKTFSGTTKKCENEN